MTYGLLTPFFLGGIALLVLPWLIHQIRRPEREVARFSSLLFVPDVKREVIERRRVQHWLLMLLRMLLLLLLTTAFTRPYRSELRLPVGNPERRSAHVIALDISASMGTRGHMEAAKAKAQAIVAALPANTNVAIVHFAALAEVIAPLFDPEDPETGSTARAQQAIASAQPTWQKTDYIAGLQAAEELLLGPGAGNARGTIHLISDFQQAGMPNETSVWQLSGSIALDPVAIGGTSPSNLSIQDLAIRSLASDSVQVRAQIRNWSTTTEATVAIELVLDNQLKARQQRVLPPQNASQVTFNLDAVKSPLVGHLQIDDDALAADNRRFFTWQPPPRSRILLIAEPGGGYERLVQAAMPDRDDLPWTIEQIAAHDLARVLQNTPARIIVAAALDDLAPEAFDHLRRHLEAGGQLLLLPNARTNPAPINRLLKEQSGIQLIGPYADAVEPSQFARLEWVDLQHPIFQPFRGPRFNDFSALRFYNYYRLDLRKPARVLARFATEPAIVETPFRKGRVLLWAGGLDRTWSTLARSPRFVPLLHESLHYLAPPRQARPSYLVGDIAVAPQQIRANTALLPNGDTVQLPAANAQALQQPGFLRWRTVSGQTHFAAVNIAAAESNPTRIPPEELAIRLSDSPVHIPGVVRDAAFSERVHKREYGRLLIAVLFGLLLLENGYAAYLARSGERKPD